MFEKTILDGYAGLIFDMDGTLIDTMPVHARAWGLVGEQFGYRFNSQIMYDLGGATVRTIAAAIMQEAGMPQQHLDEVVLAKRKLSYELLPKESKLLPTFDIVRHYHQQKPIALGSGSHRQMINMLMQKLDIGHYFDAIVSADDVAHHKPHPETFLRCAELAKVEPTRCIVFEDADLGVQAGLSGGMDVFDVRTQEIIKA